MKLSTIRSEKGFSQKDMMRDVGLYSKIETGKAIAIPEDCRRFAEMLGVSEAELFTESEAEYFGGLFKGQEAILSGGKEFDGIKLKIVSVPVCKSQKRHFEQLRKCYWLGKTRNEELKRIIAAEGFRTEQEWYSYIVDQEIEKAARSAGTEQSGNDKDIKENISQKGEKVND